MKKKFTVRELADEFQVSYRTMWRYLQELSELGVPLYSEPGVQGGYFILKEHKLSPKPKKIFNTILKKEELKLVGYEFSAPYHLFSEAEVLIPRLWFKLFNQIDEIPAIHLNRIGIAHNRKTDFSYWVTVEVQNFEQIPNEMVQLTIPPKTYASFFHKGSMERDNINQTYKYIQKWLKENNYQQDQLSNIIEIYDHKYQPYKRNNTFEILIPIQE